MQSVTTITSVCKRAWRAGIAILALAGFIFTVTETQAASVTASVDRPTITLGENVVLSINFDGIQPAGQPQLPSIPGFNLAGTGQSSRFGGGVVQISFQYTLIPTTAGDFTIPAFQVAGGNQTFTTSPIKIKVVRPGSAVSAPGYQAPIAFMQFAPLKTNVYAGEMFPLDLRLYAMEGRYETPGFSGDGFTIGKVGQPTQSQATISNQNYNVVTFRVAIMPVKTGLQTLNANMSFAVIDRSRGVDFFGQYTYRRIPLAADPLVLNVLPLPATNLPPGYAGTVGNYNLQVTAAPTEVAAGDPITVKVQIQGTGYLEGLTLPPQPDWSEFKCYPPESKVSLNDALGMMGVKNFEMVVIPQNHEVKALPPFQFTFFDPNQKCYRTLASQPIPLKVKQGAGSGAPLPTLSGLSNKTDHADKSTELTPIKVHLGPVSPAGKPLYQQPLFLLFQCLPPLVWATCLIRRKRNESLARNPRLIRQRQTARIIHEGLAQLREQAGANNKEAFFATLFRLLQEQIGERLNVPSSAITEAVIDDHLRPAAIDESLLKELHDLFQQCNLARYAAAHSGSELNDLAARTENALESLKNIPEMEVK